MWSTKIADKQTKDGSLLVNVSFYNGVRDFNEVYSVRSQEELAQIVKAKLLELEKIDTAESSVSLGSYTAPDKVQTEREVFYNALETLRRIKRAIDLGVIDDTHPKYKESVQEVKSLFKPEFLALF